MVEVGLVLPIFILTIVAVLEFGYFVAVASAVSTASREGARFGSTVDDSDGTPNYLDCDAIEDQAQKLAGALISVTDITVEYDTNGDILVNERTCDAAVLSDIKRWDRIVVSVEHEYNPITPIFRALIGSQTLTSVDRRSIVCDC